MLVSSWDSSVWVGLVVGLVGILLAIAAWRWPRAPQLTAPQAHERARVEVSNLFPVFDRPDGTRDVGDHIVGVTLRNGESRPLQVTGWGFLIPGDRRLVLPAPAVPWDPPLPAWVAAGGAETWNFPAGLVRAKQRDLACAFDELIGFVTLADGRELVADKGVPLA